MTEREIARAKAEFTAQLNRDMMKTLSPLRDPRGRVVLNADDLFSQHPLYRESHEARKFLGPALYPVARDFTNRAYLRLLSVPLGSDDIVVSTAGGGASGKSTVLRAEAKRLGVEFIVDTTLSGYARAFWQISAALDVGRKVNIHYVYRPFEDCVRGMLERALDPKVGRVVPVDDLARTHNGSQQTIIQLLSDLSGDDRVRLRSWENVGVNQAARMSAAMFAERIHPSVDVLKERGQDTLDAIYKEKDRFWNAGKIPEELYQAASSKSVPRGLS